MWNLKIKLFHSLLTIIKEKHFNTKFDHEENSEKIKVQLLKQQQNECNVCKEIFKKI